MGRTAWLSELVKCTVPVYPIAVLPLASRAVTVKFWEEPAVVGEEYPVTDNAVAEPATNSVPFAVAVPLWQPAPLPAVTVNG